MDCVRTWIVRSTDWRRGVWLSVKAVKLPSYLPLELGSTQALVHLALFHGSYGFLSFDRKMEISIEK